MHPENENKITLMYADGSKVMDIDVHTPMTVTSETKYEHNRFATIKTAFKTKLEMEVSNPDSMLDSFMNVPEGKTFTLTALVPDGEKQARVHKKRRINKKWLKRYGMTTKYSKIKIPKMHLVGAEPINPNESDVNTYKFVLE